MAAEVDDENVDYPDMVNMPVLSKELMNTNVSNRFKKDAIYTLVSDVLIAVNPFRRLESVMGDEAFDIYHYTQPAETIRRSPPHIFMIARRAFNGAIGLGGTASNQVI
jgi:myosin heavy subunit